MYFYNYHVFPGLICEIYEMGYYKAEQKGDLALAEETHLHECHTNHPYLDARYMEIDAIEAEELQVTHFVNCEGITIQTTDAGLDSLLRALNATDEIKWNNEETN